MNGKSAVIVGAGGVLGAALVREFSVAHYVVAALRRDGTVAGAARSLACDLADPAATREAVAGVVAELGSIDVLVCNAARLDVAPFANLREEDFETAWRVSVAGAVGAVQAAVPRMLAQRRGAIVFTGATASLRGAARFAAFASAKCALRGLAQSLAREYQSQGIHVAHVVVDGVLRGSPSVDRFGKEIERTIEPQEAARAYRWLAEQPPSAWTHEIDLRPYAERF